jgi:VanZ family protein
MALQILVRAAAWLLLAAIVVLSLVPAAARPTTMAPHALEHAVIFLLDGMAFGIAYSGRERWAITGAVVFCAVVELAQVMVPGRHARISDFVVDAIAACTGVLAGPPLIRVTGRYS